MQVNPITDFPTGENRDCRKRPTDRRAVFPAARELESERAGVGPRAPSVPPTAFCPPSGRYRRQRGREIKGRSVAGDSANRRKEKTCQRTD